MAQVKVIASIVQADPRKGAFVLGGIALFIIGCFFVMLADA